MLLRSLSLSLSLSVSLYLSRSLSVCLSVSQYLCFSLYLSLSVCLSISLSLSLSVSMSVCLSLSLSLFLSLYGSLSLARTCAPHVRLRSTPSLALLPSSLSLGTGGGNAVPSFGPTPVGQQGPEPVARFVPFTFQISRVHSSLLLLYYSHA